MAHFTSVTFHPKPITQVKSGEKHSTPTEGHPTIYLTKTYQNCQGLQKQRKSKKLPRGDLRRHDPRTEKGH